MTRTLKIALPSLALAALLAACGGSDTSATMTPVVTPPAPAPQEDQFGKNFGTAYRTNPLVNPVAVADGDIIPLSLVTNPVDVK